MMQVIKYISVFFVFLILLVACKDQQVSTDNQSEQSLGKITLSFSDVPLEIVHVIAKLSRRGFEERTLSLEISDTGKSATGTFQNIPTGVWHLRVEALDSRKIVQYSGETDVEVFPGETSVVTLELLPSSGNLEIHVTWGRACTPVPAGIVSWWTGDGNADDIRGGNNGVLVGGTSFTPGHVRGAFSFDGINDRVNIGDKESLKITGSLTIEAWVKIISYPRVSGGHILFRGDDRAALDPYTLTVSADGKIQFHISSLDTIVDIWAPIPLGRFIHVAATLDSASGAMRIYLDGVLASETTTTVRPFRDLDVDYNPDIGIGNHGGHFHNYPLHAVIDELSVYRRALSAVEVHAIFNAGRSGKCR